MIYGSEINRTKRTQIYANANRLDPQTKMISQAFTFYSFAFIFLLINLQNSFLIVITIVSMLWTIAILYLYWMLWLLREQDWCRNYTQPPINCRCMQHQTQGSPRVTSLGVAYQPRAKYRKAWRMHADITATLIAQWFKRTFDQKPCHHLCKHQSHRIGCLFDQ